MKYGGGNVPGGSDLLASEADREATQAVLKQAFEDERLTQDEFEARVGKAVAARTQGELAALTRDIPRPAAAKPRRVNRFRLLAGGVACWPWSGSSPGYCPPAPRPRLPRVAALAPERGRTPARAVRVSARWAPRQARSRSPMRWPMIRSMSSQGPHC
jgi:Domain of unknown function (DUF1707)